MTRSKESWCERDEHRLFEHFIDFNNWLDNREEDDAVSVLMEHNIEHFVQPSKAFYAGDREAYEQVFKAYRIQRRHEVLSNEFLNATFSDEHWFERNEERFNQLVERLIENAVVPFIGAGISVAGGFPTWKNHLRQQGRTAGIPPEETEAQLENGNFENVIKVIESERGRDVFAQEIRDVFSKTGDITDITLRISELFDDTLITTNYDRLLEQVFDTGSEKLVQLICGIEAMEVPASNKTTIIKIHGDIKSPQRCILGKNQYDQAYGIDALDMNLQIPKLLEYYFKNSSLLFIGCSLNNDRTMKVFEAVKIAAGDADIPQHFSIEQSPESEDELVLRNAALLRLGITAIWFAKGQYDLVESILRHAKNEVKYRTGEHQATTISETNKAKSEGIYTLVKSALSKLKF